MKTTTAGADTVLNAPIRGWWGWYFLVNVVIAFAAPYFANEHDRLYSPAIACFFHFSKDLYDFSKKKLWDMHLNTTHTKISTCNLTVTTSMYVQDCQLVQ